MSVIKDSTHWLVEAKFIRRGNATGAVREALGQLAAYAFCLYPPEAQPRKLALFSESVGEVYTRLLEHHGIAGGVAHRRRLGRVAVRANSRTRVTPPPDPGIAP